MRQTCTQAPFSETPMIWGLEMYARPETFPSSQSSKTANRPFYRKLGVGFSWLCLFGSLGRVLRFHGTHEHRPCWPSQPGDEGASLCIRALDVKLGHQSCTEAPSRRYPRAEASQLGSTKVVPADLHLWKEFQLAPRFVIN